MAGSVYGTPASSVQNTPAMGYSVPPIIASATSTSSSGGLLSGWGRSSSSAANKSTDSVNTVGGGNGVGRIFTDVTGAKEEVSVKEVDEQGEWESRKLWKLVAKGIREGDFDVASKEKTKIEVGFPSFFFLFLSLRGGANNECVLE